MKTVTKLERFRLDNGLTKKKLAEYLGVSDVFLGKMCSGDYKLPEKHAVKLVDNDQGWNTAALLKLEEKEVSVPAGDIPRLFANKEGIELMNDIKTTLRAINETLESLNEGIKRKDEQIATLLKIVDNITK